MGLQSISERRIKIDNALKIGPEALISKDKKEIPCDPDQFFEFHKFVWNTSDRRLSKIWGIHS